MTSCIFCKIASGEVSAQKLVDTADYFIIRDLHPKAPKHYLLIPKQHYALLEEQTDVQAKKFGLMLQSLKNHEKVLGIEQGYSLRINQKAGGGQEVMHLHVHILAN